MRGAHNGQNAAFAYAAATALGVAREDIARAFATFPASRTAWRRSAGGAGCCSSTIRKATNADAAEKALLSFRDIFWILGGKAKEGGIEPLRPLFRRVAKAYLIGAAADDFAATLEGAVAYERCGTLSHALEAAARDAAARRPRSRSCSCRPPAPRSTSSPISRRAATRSAQKSDYLLNGEP